MGGGGGNTTTSTTAIDPDIKKRVLPVLSDVTQRYQQEQAQGPGAVVADQTLVADNLAKQGALAADVRDQGLAQQVATDLQNFSGQQQTQGGLNSARQQRANAAGLADRSLQLRQADLQARKEGAQGAVASAEGIRGLQQQTLDAPHTSAQRYFGYLSSAPQGSTSKQSQGGGK